jgi:uncharacterized protein (TIGR03067 family)
MHLLEHGPLPPFQFSGGYGFYQHKKEPAMCLRVVILPVAILWCLIGVGVVNSEPPTAARVVSGLPDDVTKWPEAVVPMDDSPAFERFRQAARRSNAEWWVAEAGGRVTARPYRPTEPAPSFFCELTALPELVRRNYGPNQKAVEVADGWLVGYNAGEWGAAVVWYSADGKVSRLVCEDPVNQFVKTKEGVFAATGLDHLFYGLGSVIRFVHQEKMWKPETVAVLSESAAVAVSALPDGKLLVATGHRVVRVAPDGAVKTLVRSGCSPYLGWPFPPNSVAGDAEGRVYLGMQQFVAVFDPKDPVGWTRLRTPTKKWACTPSKTRIDVPTQPKANQVTTTPVVGPQPRVVESDPGSSALPLGPLSPDRAHEEIDSNLAALQGTWESPNVARKGEVSHSFSIDGNKVLWSETHPGKAEVATLVVKGYTASVGPQANPKVMLLKAGRDDFTDEVAIFEIRANQLRLCLGAGGKLPKGFDDKTARLIVLTYVPPLVPVARAVLERAAEWELLALDPDGLPGKTIGERLTFLMVQWYFGWSWFHDWRVLGTMKVTDPATRKTLLAALNKGIAEAEEKKKKNENRACSRPPAAFSRGTAFEPLMKGNRWRSSSALNAHRSSFSWTVGTSRSTPARRRRTRLIRCCARRKYPWRDGCYR